jgi:hypothetical protein
LVIEFRHARWNESDAGRRLAIGARRWALSSGEPVRHLDIATFEVIATGELLRRLS